MRKNELINKHAVRAISIGLSAAMVLSPITVLAEDDADSGSDSVGQEGTNMRTEEEKQVEPSAESRVVSDAKEAVSDAKEAVSDAKHNENHSDSDKEDYENIYTELEESESGLQGVSDAVGELDSKNQAADEAKEKYENAALSGEGLSEGDQEVQAAVEGALADAEDVLNAASDASGTTAAKAEEVQALAEKISEARQITYADAEAAAAAKVQAEADLEKAEQAYEEAKKEVEEAEEKVSSAQARVKLLVERKKAVTDAYEEAAAAVEEANRKLAEICEAYRIELDGDGNIVSEELTGDAKTAYDAVMEAKELAEAKLGSAEEELSRVTMTYNVMCKLLENIRSDANDTKEKLQQAEDEYLMQEEIYTTLDNIMKEYPEAKGAYDDLKAEMENYEAARRAMEEYEKSDEYINAAAEVDKAKEELAAANNELNELLEKDLNGERPSEEDIQNALNEASQVVADAREAYENALEEYRQEEVLRDAFEAVNEKYENLPLLHGNLDKNLNELAGLAIKYQLLKAGFSVSDEDFREWKWTSIAPKPIDNGLKCVFKDAEGKTCIVYFDRISSDGQKYSKNIDVCSKDAVFKSESKENEFTVSYNFESGKVTYLLDGEPVPGDQVTMEDGCYIITDENGVTIRFNTKKPEFREKVNDNERVSVTENFVNAENLHNPVMDESLLANLTMADSRKEALDDAVDHANTARDNLNNVESADAIKEYNRLVTERENLGNSASAARDLAEEKLVEAISAANDAKNMAEQKRDTAADVSEAVNSAYEKVVKAIEALKGLIEQQGLDADKYLELVGNYDSAIQSYTKALEAEGIARENLRKIEEALQAARDAVGRGFIYTVVPGDGTGGVPSDGTGSVQGDGTGSMAGGAGGTTGTTAGGTGTAAAGRAVNTTGRGIAAGAGAAAGRAVNTAAIAPQGGVAGDIVQMDDQGVPLANFNLDGEEVPKGDVLLKDEEVPKGSLDLDESKISWWWLLLIAVFGATGYEMYRKHQKEIR